MKGIKGKMVEVNVCDFPPHQKHCFRQRRLILPHKDGDTLVYAIVRERVRVWLEDIEPASYIMKYSAEVLYEVEISKETMKKFLAFITYEKELAELAEALYGLKADLATGQMLKNK